MDTPQTSEKAVPNPKPGGGSTGAIGQSALIEWANQQDHWVRALVSELISTRQGLLEERVPHYYELLLKEKELAPGTVPDVPLLSGSLNGSGAGETFILSALEGVQDVNALTPAQRIAFNPRMTVLFGENASGKTGYVRILKRAAAVRTAEAVLPNVIAVSTKIPRARISYQIGTKSETLDWANEAGLHPFTRMDVLDSRGSQLHLDEDLTYIYTPGELSLFPMVQQGLEKVKTKLESDMKLRTVNTNPFLREFERGSPMYAKIESLGAATNMQELRRLADVPEEDRTLVNTLTEEIEALRSQSPEAQSKVVQSEQKLLESVSRTLNVIATFDSAGYESARTELAQARQRFDQATTQAFAGLEIPGILQPAWKAFIQAGEELLSATGQQQYPSATDECLFCRQRLDGAAVELIKKYRDYCNNELQASVTSAEQAFVRCTSPIAQLSLVSIQENVRSSLAQAAAGKSPLRSASDVIASAIHLQAQIAAKEGDGGSSISQEAGHIAKNIDAQREELSRLETDLKQRSGERQSALKERQARFLDISSRLRLADRLLEIEHYVSEAQWVTKAGIVVRRFQAIFRSLTEASKSASERLLNQNFEKRFRRECKRLRAPDVKLFFPGRQGQVARRKSVVADHRLSEILSEGEQKVIALADFLAEVELKSHAPVIFDDPVNSLDYRRMNELVDRLVAFSRERQVIIFTHNIWFTMELLSRFDKAPADCSYYDVQADGVRFGIVTKGTHPRADTYKVLKGKLNNLIQSAAKEAGETQVALIEKCYEYLRSICEVLVEVELLQGVTQRYQPNVGMTKLPNIKFERLREASESISSVFEKCCRCIASHSQPLETLNVRPSLSELQTDWKTVEDALNKYRE
jgi:recombinational DNA repair ATPase RecF